MLCWPNDSMPVHCCCSIGHVFKGRAGPSKTKTSLEAGATTREIPESWPMGPHFYVIAFVCSLWHCIGTLACLPAFDGGREGSLPNSVMLRKREGASVSMCAWWLTGDQSMVWSTFRLKWPGSDFSSAVIPNSTGHWEKSMLIYVFWMGWSWPTVPSINLYCCTLFWWVLFLSLSVTLSPSLSFCLSHYR